MRRKVGVAVALGVALGSLHMLAVASKGVDEAKERGCLRCHDVEKKKIGPAFKDVSAKLKGKSIDDAVAAMKGKAVHKAVLEDTQDGSLKEILGWVQSL